MKITRKTNILVSAEQKFAIRQSPSDEQKICGQCGGQMMTAQTISALTGIGIREIYRLIEKADVHFIETCSDQTHVCLGSISQLKKKT